MNVSTTMLIRSLGKDCERKYNYVTFFGKYCERKYNYVDSFFPKDCERKYNICCTYVHSPSQRTNQHSCTTTFTVLPKERVNIVVLTFKGCERKYNYVDSFFGKEL